ncbi:ABC transporter substrate-binding protein [Homoserinimonas sp. OAct 916]|uniref:ABC transporter substrate-binding protein n=1 Tax=Homoserinimonas sp. OAct 916 TaxID=2211450 RepID=UPI000DBE662B|nr:ABC transporter substrate-binding protein [Homoserinimonas sp. OAct 916]
MSKKFFLSTVVFAAGTALLLSGCVNNSGPETPAASTPPSSQAPAADGVDAAAAALLPARIKDAGKLVIGIDPTYPPNESKDDAGNPIGWEVELGEALTAKLGLDLEWKISSFENIIPSVNAGTMDLGLSSFTDNIKREEQVDFVNYYFAGTLWASPAGKAVDPDDACGLIVAVQATTRQETDELPAKSEACTKAGKKPIDILKFASQEEATSALVLGRADAMTAAGPVVGYAVTQTGGKLQVDGQAFDASPYGIVVSKKETELSKATQAALQSMVDDGSYMKILDKWGQSAGAVQEITINAASKGK